MVTLILGFLLCMVAASEGCDRGWTQFDESCYYFGTSPVNWFKAWEICSHFGAQLVTFETKREHGYVKEKARQMGGSYWIGGNDLAKEGRYTWASNGQLMTVTDWHTTEPNSGSSENCILMYRGSQYTYHDNNCVGRKWEYICEKRIDKSTCDGGFKKRVCKRLKSLAEMC